MFPCLQWQLNNFDLQLYPIVHHVGDVGFWQSFLVICTEAAPVYFHRCPNQLLGSAKEFYFLQSIQPGSGTHQAFSSAGTRGSPKGEVAGVQS